MNVPLQPQPANMAAQIASKTIEYLSVPSVVGHERLFMDAIAQDFTDLGLHVQISDSYVAVSGSQPNAALICAHLDRHGLISLGDDEYVYAAQYIKEIKYGDNNQLAQQQLENIARRFEGESVFAYDPATGANLGNGVIEACNPRMLNGDALFFIDTMPTIDVDMPVAYARRATYAHGQLKGQIDNAVSLGAIYHLFKNGFQGTALFAAEEEIGKSWLHIRDYLTDFAVENQNILILDTSPYSDQTIVDKGSIVFRKSDMSGHFNTDLVAALIAHAQRLNLPFEIKDEALLAMGKTQDQLGSTELGRLIEGTNGRWSGATIQIPTLMYHTSNETTTERALNTFFTFLKHILIDSPMPVLASNKD